MSLGKPGAGLRSIESSVAEMEHIFDHIFGVENGNHLVSESDESVPDLLQVYGSDEDMYATSYPLRQPTDQSDSMLTTSSSTSTIPSYLRRNDSRPTIVHWMKIHHSDRPVH